MEASGDTHIDTQAVPGCETGAGLCAGAGE